MRQIDPQDRSRKTVPAEATWAGWMPVIAAMGIMIAGCLSTFLVLQMDEFRPKLGDIVVFRPGSQDTDMWEMIIPGRLLPTAGNMPAECALDPNVMAEKGGSLIVEARQDKPLVQYQIHWQGSRTARTSNDCGRTADLEVSRTDLQRLANAAGGFGVDDRGPVH